MIPLSGLIFWVDVIVKLFTKNACLFLQILETITRLKLTRKKF